MFHKITHLEVLPDLTLWVAFTDHVECYYCVKDIFPVWPQFQALETINGLFEQVKIEPSGYGISWNDELDLSSEELYEHGKRLYPIQFP